MNVCCMSCPSAVCCHHSRNRLVPAPAAPSSTPLLPTSPVRSCCLTFVSFGSGHEFSLSVPETFQSCFPRARCLAGSQSSGAHTASASDPSPDKSCYFLLDKSPKWGSQGPSLQTWARVWVNHAEGVWRRPVRTCPPTCEDEGRMVLVPASRAVLGAVCTVRSQTHMRGHTGSAGRPAIYAWPCAGIAPTFSWE